MEWKTNKQTLCNGQHVNERFFVMRKQNNRYIEKGDIVQIFNFMIHKRENFSFAATDDNIRKKNN